MIMIRPTKEMLEAAKEEAEALGPLPHSFTDGDGTPAGFLAEMVVAQYMGYTRVKGNYDYDLISPDEKQKVDVKTKRCSSPPLPHYENSIAAYNPTQDCDRYVFVRVKKDLSVVWILGELTKEEYFAKAVYYNKGDIDRSNNWVAPTACYNVPISELDEVKTWEMTTRDDDQ